jgi:hypothetical protein
MGVVVQIAPGRTEREHRVFVGIGDREDNPATKYLRREYAFRLSGDVKTLITWKGSDWVTLKVVEYPNNASEKRNSDARLIATYTYARPPGSVMFQEIKGSDAR